VLRRWGKQEASSTVFWTQKEVFTSWRGRTISTLISFFDLRKYGSDDENAFAFDYYKNTGNYSIELEKGMQNRRAS
jgi:uncharacterized membrane protein YdjX (TVP38/TMEM64 family)